MSRVQALLDALDLQLDLVRRLRPDELDQPSACDAWSVRDVLGHSLGVTRKFADFASGATDEPHEPRDDVLGEDHRGAAAREVAFARDAWTAADLTRTCRLRFGTFSAEAAAGINLFDALAHTWDMSRGTPLGISDDDALWLAGLDAARDTIGSSRDPAHYALELPSGAGAPAMHRFLSYLGRSPDDAWAPLVARFVDDHYRSLRGHVRTYVVNEHLREHLADTPQRVVDVGGGAGNQSVPLARAGHHVTIVDPSAAMVERAAARIAGESAEVAARVTLVHSSGEDAPVALDDETFDVVLCHGVLMYLDDPAPLVDSLCKLAAPGGLVSIVAKNADVMALRHAHEGDWAATIAAFDSDRQVNGLGLDTRGDRIEHLSELIAQRGVEPVAWYGVRLFTDGWTPDRAATDPEELVLRAELMASQRDPYRQLSRLFHLVGRRP